MSFWEKFIWPSRSPDMSGVENVWPLLQRYVVRDDERDQVLSEQEATDRINEFFATFSRDKCRDILRSMFSRRIDDCIKKGYDIIN